MAGMYDLVKDVFPGKQTWRLKVRIWEMCPIDLPANPFAIEMVMMDVEGDKIQATIRKPMIRKFCGSVLEGHAYKMAFFGVVRNTDMMGLLTVASSEKMSERSGHMTRFIILELTDGSYLARESEELPVVVVQYARVKAYKGVVSIQNVMNTTTIMWNPDIPEAIEFKRSLAELGFETEAAEGNFIVIATVAAILGDDAWWYSACSCMKAVNEEDGVFFCPDPEFGEIPDEFQVLVGKEMLFKVDKGPEYAFRFDDTFRMRRICVDPEIMKMFKDSVVITTPEKNKFIPPFPTIEEASSSGTVKGSEKEVVDLCGEVQLVSGGPIKGGGGGTIGEKEGKSNAESFLAVDPVVAPFAMTDVVDLES
ncbi:Nucleic acid-binding, OB-fold [Sesbania bispinosa]|nr:Nucleic acid-binding, OB-fold [Sesbania bispinosa]